MASAMRQRTKLWATRIGQEFLLRHVWSLATQLFHAHGGFEIAQTQFESPAPGVQGGQLLNPIKRTVIWSGKSPHSLADRIWEGWQGLVHTKRPSCLASR